MSNGSPYWTNNSSRLGMNGFSPGGGMNRNCSLDSVFNERAGPRMSASLIDRRQYHHPVLPASNSSSTTAPHYAQASQLYPMRPSYDSDTSYRYRPSYSHQNQYSQSGSSTPVNSSHSLMRHTRGHQSPSNQAINIPVVHLGASHAAGRSSNTSDTSSVSGASYTGGYSAGSGGNGNLEHGSGGSNGATTVIPVRRKPGGSAGGMTQNDPAADSDVDQLTNILMRSMETRGGHPDANYGPSSAASITPTADTPTNITSQKRYNISTNGSMSLNNRVNRLQHQTQPYGQQHFSPGGHSSAQNGRGSPGNVMGSQGHGTPTTASPSGSVSGGMDQMGNPMNTCFRCHRPLMPPEGSTLNTQNNQQLAANIVSLTGAVLAKLHASCFTCYHCSAPLKQDAYYHTMKKLLCPPCVNSGAVETCHHCHRSIGDRVVRALGHPYHPGCFTCVVCGQRLDACPFTVDVNGKPHCLPDFHKRYAPRCASCGRPITPEPGSQEAKRVVVGDANYHLHCFGVTASSSSSGAVGQTATVAS